MIAALIGLALIAPIGPVQTDIPDLRPLCIVALGVDNPDAVTNCVVRLQTLRINLPIATAP